MVGERVKMMKKIFLRKAKISSIIKEKFLLHTVVGHQFLSRVGRTLASERGDVPGWVLVVLMTTGLVTGIWTLAAPRIDSILRNSLDSMNAIR